MGEEPEMVDAYIGIAHFKVERKLLESAELLRSLRPNAFMEIPDE